ncbi:hypothetical protein [Thauera sp. 2A1]|nr:hypothetical protein [Thauera sp. 2A1]KAI5916153.1 hypothetical protein GH664_04415 [Thauera sp. 2A1]
MVGIDAEHWKRSLGRDDGRLAPLKRKSGFHGRFFLISWRRR